MSKAIELCDVAFRYTGAGLGFRLNIPTLEIDEGEKIALVGSSGSGKSTLLGLISGVLVPQNGTIDILGTQLNDLSSSKRDAFRADNLGIIFQQFNLLPYLSVIENVTLGLEFSKHRKMPAREKQSRATQLLEALEIDVLEMGNQKVASLSVGQQQRVAVARAFVTEPKVIIADEPTSALDEGRQNDFLNLLFAQQTRTNATLLLVTHDRRIAERFDRTIDLKDICEQSNAPGEAA